VARPRKKYARVTSKSQKKCLEETCDGAAKKRGLCDNCYRVAWNSIRQGWFTDEQLVEAGRILPKGGKESNWLKNTKKALGIT
jgi:hypothetical protein